MSRTPATGDALLAGRARTGALWAPWVFIAPLVLMLTGCALRASHGDYGAYRAFRLADDDRQRVLTGAGYLADYPAGVYADEVRAALAAREERYYASRAASADGLAEYLRIYPEGRYAARARAELAAFAQRESEDVAARERARAQSEDDAAEALRAHRGFTRERLARFLGALLRVRAWGQPMDAIVQAYPELDRAFAEAPRPTCDPTRCTKVLRVSFALPLQDGAVVQRASELRVVLRLADERLLGAELWLPERGFSRWFELETRRVVDDRDPEARREAVSWALAQLAPWLNAGLGEGALAADRPALDSTEPHTPLLALDAEGLSVDVVVAGVDDAGLDGLVIGPRLAAR